MAQSFVASDHEKRKHPSSDDFIDEETSEAGQQGIIDENFPKRVKMGFKDNDEVAHTTPNIEELVKENETLQHQLHKTTEDLDRCRKEREKEREMMLGIIDKLTKRAK